MLTVVHLMPFQCWSSGRLALQVTVYGLAQYEPIAQASWREMAATCHRSVLPRTPGVGLGTCDQVLPFQWIRTVLPPFRGKATAQTSSGEVRAPLSSAPSGASRAGGLATV